MDFPAQGTDEGSKDSGFIMIRSEREEDYAAVHAINEMAFGGPAEARLVDALRPVADPAISLVAVDQDNVVGHIFFSPVSLNSADSEPFMAMGLAPMAVHPRHQGRGIGSMLVREGLRRCREMGQLVVVVLGHPWFYPQFGFVPASSRGIRSEYDVADDVFMVAELEPDALGGRTGLIRYRPEFADL